jgi:hypothetical protein
MSAKKSDSKTYVTSYRIAIDDKKAIVKKHGSLSAFLNQCVQAELAKLGKVKTAARRPNTKLLKKAIVKTKKEK